MDSLLVGRHILVVEDELLIAMSIEDMLQELGCASIATAATVEQALALIESQSFDAATLDINLNGTTSYPIADALEARHIPFVFATGYSNQGIAGEYRTCRVLRKPFRSIELAALFVQMLGESDSSLEDSTAGRPAGRI